MIYAKSVLADATSKALYQASVINGKSAFNLAVADFLKPPVITEMDISNYTGQAGEKIRVRASDNFRIREVRVTIYLQDNTVVESGVAAPQVNGLDYIYEITQVSNDITGGRIIAEATDLPGQRVQMSRML